MRTGVLVLPTMFIPGIVLGVLVLWSSKSADSNMYIVQLYWSTSYHVRVRALGRKSDADPRQEWHVMNQKVEWLYVNDQRKKSHNDNAIYKI